MTDAAPAGDRRGVALTLVVMGIMPALDLLYGGVALLAAWLGLVPPASLATLIAVRAALIAALVAGKGYLLTTLIRRPARLAWMVRSWAMPIATAALAVLAVPLLVGVGAGHAVLARRGLDRALADGRVARRLGDVLAEWTVANALLTLVAALSTAAIWAAAILIAYRRSLPVSGPSSSAASAPASSAAE